MVFRRVYVYPFSYLVCLINLDELHQLRSDSHVIKIWLSQPHVNVRLPYQEDEITAPRIVSVVGSTNDIEFLRSDLVHSRWISFEVDSIDYLDGKGKNVLTSVLD